MSDANPVRDGYESYYTEKLWQLVPEVYRHEDGLAANPGVLRRLVELIGDEVARSRRSIDRLWEDQHIETCDDWAVPYIGDLVGARLVSANDRRARRVDVAKAINFRRRRGTPDLLDSLVRAMSNWDVVLVEGFRRLARTRHRLDPVPRAGGFFTGTLSGGTADLRSPAGAEVSDGPFDEYFHTLDTRLLRGRDGRFGINKLNFHLYRLRAYEMTNVDPVLMTDPAGPGFPRIYTIDPSGRDVQLFIDAAPPDPDAVAALPGQLSRPACGLPREWEVTQAMRCRLLGHVAHVVTASHVEELRQLPNPPGAADEQALFRILEVRFESERALRRRLRDLGAGIAVNPPDWYRELVTLSLLEQTGKANLYPAQVEISAVGVSGRFEPFAGVRVAAANLASRECQPDPENNLATLLISPEQGRFASVPPDDPANFEPFVERYHYGFSGDVGAGSYPRDPIPAADVPSRVAVDGVVPGGGVLQGDGLLVSDNRTYSLSIVAATPIDNAVLQAGPKLRPYVVLSDGGANLRPLAINTTFLIDGGWYGAGDPSNPPAAGAVADFVIEGAASAATEAFDFERVEIRFATLDPGGVRADGVRIPPLRLLVRARVRQLIIRRSITGPIHVVRDNPDDPSMVEELLICESIVDARETIDRLAVSSNFGTVVIEGSTIFGDVAADVLKASDSIVDGQVRVVNNQAGCFRFSASEPGDDVRLPPRYRDAFAPIPESAFNSTTFGDAQYAQLSVVAPPALLRGAENGSEMGVFSHLLSPIRLASVRAKVNEFGPVGLLAQYLFEGDYRAQSLVEFGVLNPTPEESPPPPPPDPGDVIPEPPPEEEEPLPTTCPDEEPPTGEEPPPQIAELTIVNINGAPEFWRDVDWREEVFPAPNPNGVRREGVPFDRVRVLLEYDARFGTPPDEQGWTPNNEEAAALYTLDGRGGLAFRIDNRPAFFTAQAELDEELPAQMHAYASVFLDEVPEARAVPFDGFEQRVEVNDDKRPSRGMRADWLRTSERTTDGRELHYLTLDGREILGSPKPAREARGWHELSMQCCFSDDDKGGCLSGLIKMKLPNDAKANAEARDAKANAEDDVAVNAARRIEGDGRALLSFDAHVDELKLRKFGESRGDLGRASLRAVFGFEGKTGQMAGRLRNFVVSAPGRYVRAWMTGNTPSRAPMLRLAFVTQERVTAGVRFRVRYGRQKKNDPTLPLRVAEATLKLVDTEPGRETLLEIPLPAVRAKDTVVLTLERDSSHTDDTLETSIRMMSAALVAR
ncbi:MAG TPA: hypothetical protein VF240_18640 [Pyrinomonadaceae bacterium]